MISIVPNNIIKFEDEAGQYNFPIKRTLKMMDIMGYKEHRLFNDSVILSDVAVYGLNYMFENNIINKRIICMQIAKKAIITTLSAPCTSKFWQFN